MSLILSQISLKKNGLTQIVNSNTNIFIKKNLIRKSGGSNTQNETYDKIVKKNNNHLINTSVKKNRQLKKISINDYENKKVILKNCNSPKIMQNSNKSLLIKKNTLLKTKKKLGLDNKENQRNNNKDKNKIKKKPLNMMLNNTKMKIKQNLTQIQKNIKTQILNKNNGNKLLKYIDIENSTERENNEQQNKKLNINENENKLCNTKEIIKTNKTLILSPNRVSYIENGKPNESNEEEIHEKEEKKLINISHDDDIEYILKYERNNKSEKKMFNAKSNSSTDKINPLFNKRKEGMKYSFRKKNENPRLNIVHRKINSEDNFMNDDINKIYNSLNNEKEKGNIDLINNFDIINIISRKEQYKKLSRSLRNNLNNGKTKEISEENIKEQKNNNKQYPIRKFKLNGLNIIYSDSNEITKEKEIKHDEILTAKTVRNNNPINKSISLVNSKKNIGLNKWNKNYPIPTVNATLTKGEGAIKEKKFFLKKKLNKKINNIIEYNQYNTNPKKHVNFGYNNKKKREILFNFKNENLKYLNFRTNRTNSFIDKRNMHITERNHSINNTINENDNFMTNRDVDLDIQEKKLKLICREINKYKFRKKFQNPDLCSFSLDKQINMKLYKNKNKEEDEDINIKDIKINENKNILKSTKIPKKYKTFRIKLNPLNIIKMKNDSFINGNNKLVIKRGDLLNRLRKIKQDYSKVEVSSIE